MSNQLDTQNGGVPAQMYNPATSIESEDVALPRIKIAHYMHGYVQDGALTAGAIFSETGPDDPEPATLVPADKGDKGTPDDHPGLEFYVLQGPLKGWSHSVPGGPLETWRFDDPSRHPDAWRTYKYILAVPSVDEDVPYSILLTKTSIPAAKQLNTVLVRSAGSRPTSEIAFRLRTKFRSNERGKFYIAQISLAPEPANKAEREAREHAVEVASRLAGIVGSQSQHSSTPAAVEEPAI